MAIFQVDGEEIYLEGIEHDTIVIARPTKKLSPEESRQFNASIQHLSHLFEKHHCTLIGAGYNTATFEVIKAKAGEAAAT